MIVLNWSVVENCLDYWTAIAFQDYGGDKLEPELPRMFSRKVTFLRKAFNRLPGLAPFRYEALKHLERAYEISHIRHYMVHGLAVDFDPENDESFTFLKVDVNSDKTEHVVGELVIPGQDLIDASKELIVMAYACQQLTTRMLEALEPQDMPD